MRNHNRFQIGDHRKTAYRCHRSFKQCKIMQKKILYSLDRITSRRFRKFLRKLVRTNCRQYIHRQRQRLLRLHQHQSGEAYWQAFSIDHPKTQNTHWCRVEIWNHDAYVAKKKVTTKLPRNLYSVNAQAAMAPSKKTKPTGNQCDTKLFIE